MLRRKGDRGLDISGDLSSYHAVCMNKTDVSPQSKVTAVVHSLELFGARHSPTEPLVASQPEVPMTQGYPTSLLGKSRAMHHGPSR